MPAAIAFRGQNTKVHSSGHARQRQIFSIQRRPQPAEACGHSARSQIQSTAQTAQVQKFVYMLLSAHEISVECIFKYSITLQALLCASEGDAEPAALQATCTSGPQTDLGRLYSFGRQVFIAAVRIPG